VVAATAALRSSSVGNCEGEKAVTVRFERMTSNSPLIEVGTLHRALKVGSRR
jgi:hypothetical protein